MTTALLPAFAVPSVQRAAGQAADAENGDVPAFPTWLSEATAETMAKTVDELLLAATPLISALTIAGYDISAMAVAPTDATDHLYVELSNRHFSIIEQSLADSIGQPTPPTNSSGLTIALAIQPRRRYRPYGLTWDIGTNLAMDLPSVINTGDQGPALDDGIGHWIGAGGPADPLAVLHDPRALNPSTDGWFVIGHDTGDASDESKIGAAIEEATANVAALVVADLVTAWNGQPETLPGLLGMLDTRTWQFLDGTTPFAAAITAQGKKVQAWLGRPVESPANRTASPAEITDFFNSETWQRTGSLELWLNLAAGGGASSVIVDGVMTKAIELARQERNIIGVTDNRVAGLLRLPWMEALMGLHELGLIDILGQEDLATADHRTITLDGTGTYERRTTDLKVEEVTTPTAVDHGQGTDTLQIKVVGNTLIGRWQEHPRFMGSIRPLTYWDIEATSANQSSDFAGTASTQSVEDPVTLTVTTRHDRVMIDLVTPNETIHFMKLTREVYVEDHELGGQKLHPQFALIEESQRSPLHSFEFNELQTIAKGLINDIDLNYDGVISSTLTPADLETNFTESIRPYFHESTPNSGDHLSQARLHIRAALVESTAYRGWFFPIFGGREVDHFRLLIELHQANAADMPTVAAFFELDITKRSFWYEWDIYAHPIVGGWSGQAIGGVSVYPFAKMTIKKWRYQQGQPDHLEWTSEYWAVVAGAGLGLTFELTTGLIGSGSSAWVTMDMQPEWFHNVRLVSGSAQGWIGMGWIYSKSFLTFVQLEADAQGNNVLWTNASGWSETMGIYGGAELAASGGYLIPWSPGDPTLPPSLEVDIGPLVIDDPIDYGGASGFFATDSYARDPEVDAWLEEFCMKNLDLLRDRHASLSIVGHADPRAGDQYNLVLSRNRALAVHQRIIDLLGPHLAIREERTFIGGRGEWESAGLDHPDQFSAERRVDLHVDGKRIISVRALNPGEVPVQ